MIVKCHNCTKFFDDQFRLTGCPHDTFSANDGQNNFKHYSESWLNNRELRRGFSCPSFSAGGQSEYDAYQEWLTKNKIKV